MANSERIYLIQGNDTDMSVCLRKGGDTPLPYDLTGASRIGLALTGHGLSFFARDIVVSGEDNNIISGLLAGDLLVGEYGLEVSFTLDGKAKRFRVPQVFEVVTYLSEDQDGTAEGEGDGISITVTVQPEVIEISGPTGPQGKSAYQVWLAEGHTGTVDDFFEWLAAQTPNPDWAQNDASEPDYVENRTHYDIPAVSLPDAFITFRWTEEDYSDLMFYLNDETPMPRMSENTWGVQLGQWLLSCYINGNVLEIDLDGDPILTVANFRPGRTPQPILVGDIEVPELVQQLDGKYLGLRTVNGQSLKGSGGITLDGSNIDYTGADGDAVIIHGDSLDDNLKALDDKAYYLDINKQGKINDLDTIRAGAALGATAYQKPSGGIPAGDLAPGVIPTQAQADWEEDDPAADDYIKNKPTIPTNVVKYTEQELTEAQQEQARENIGAGTYSKPSGGIPASDLASGVIPTVPVISTDIEADKTSDTKTASAKAVYTEVSQLRSEVNVLATYGRSVLGTVKGYYDKYNGTLKSTTQNYYYADIPIPTGAQTLFVKSNFNSYGNEAVCLFGSSFIIGLFPTKAGIYVQLDGTVTTVKVSLVPSDNIEITFFKNRIYTESDIIGVAAKSRIADVVPFIDGYVFVNNGSVGDTIPGGTTGSSVYSYATAEVKRGDVIEITAIVTGGISYNTYALVDKDNKIVSCPVLKANVYNEIVTVPTDGMISVNTKTANLAISSLKIYRDESLPMAGRKVAIFGDSIVTLRDTDGFGIAEYLTRFLGCDIVRCSIGGLFLSCRVQTPVAIANITDLAQCWPYLDLGRSIPKIATGDMTDINTVYQKMQDDFGYTPSADMATAIYNWNNIDFDEIDAVIISAGTNDQRYTPEGAATDDVPYTLNGAVNIIVKSLLENYPHLSVYFFSPIVKFVENDLDQWSDDYVADGPGMNGKTLAQVAEIILGAAKRNHIPNCDMYYGMGWTRYNFLNYCNTDINDYTHPYKGFRQMAEKMAGFIVANRTFK